MTIRQPAKLCLVVLLAASVGCRAPAVAPASAVPALPTSAAVGGTSIVAISPPAQQCCPKQTLPQFLGITGLFAGLHGICDRIRNRLGSIFPGLEAKPEILALADPANLESPNPAVAAAAGVKAEEDAAAQKAKAIAYLASVGCAGCYPGIEEALLAALDDCTELVRFETAKALRSTAAMPCKNCCKSACCGPKLREKLEKIAYELDEQGCYFESSDRVRRMARLALASCNCVPVKPGQQPRLPTEGPEDEAPLVPPLPSATVSIVREPAGPRQVSAAAGRVGTGISGQSTLASPAPAAADAGAFAGASVSSTAPVARQVSYEQALAAYRAPPGNAPAAAVETAWEVWTARPGDFASRQEAVGALTLARVQVMGSPSGQSLPPQLHRLTQPWTDASRIASPALARAVATTPVGGVSGVVEDSSGWHLVRVIDRRAAPAPTPAAAPSPTAPGRNSVLATQAVSFQTPEAAAPVPVVPMNAVHSGTPGVVQWQQPNCNCK